ncbi:hypothetical protein BDV95DRAFT_151289 [Massariosphaeria phaeospora]|uniref:Indole-diterpene biosynthesis protein-like protein PaxU n=1 Tax=Massariosphaeria phaeospora TaxID=100035 RepID=A0A7C8MHB5_9PLEO|nr:hypothetical protein BDV95DRAFT_151289 [Massariosphaeria phaeospora]
MSRPRHDAIPGFSSVAPSIWEHIPPLPIDPLSEKPEIRAPHLVLLFSWTGANVRYVRKYTDKYRSIFPATRILVISTSAKDLCFRSSANKQARLQPAIQRILSYEDVEGILIHVFSEGGSNKAVELAEAYFNTTGNRLPCSALCLDSAPGHPRYLRLCNALRLSLPTHPILNCTGLVVGGVILGAIWFFYRGFKGSHNNVISKTRRRIVDPLAWDLAVPRCYLYSHTDALIASHDVQEHTREALEKGVPLMEVCFEKSAHCKHAAEDPGKYWDAVELTWRRALVRGMDASKWGNVAKEELTPINMFGNRSECDTDSEKPGPENVGIAF